MNSLVLQSPKAIETLIRYHEGQLANGDATSYDYNFHQQRLRELIQQKEAFQNGKQGKG